MLLKLHKYAGLIAGLLLALTGVTGSLLVFHDTLDEWLTPQLRTQPAADPASLSAVLAAAEA
ncbi:MAG: PepSY domain-containing protein, partial [Alcanivorax sp.]|nr:PepSY domain-containing protein [Alcanivorax sp.]